MTRLEVIQMIGDMTVEIDDLRSNMKRDDPNSRALDDLRASLDEVQRRLSLAQALFNDNTATFQARAAELYGIHREVNATIRSVERVPDTIANVERFLYTALSLPGQDEPDVP